MIRHLPVEVDACMTIDPTIQLPSTLCGSTLAKLAGDLVDGCPNGLPKTITFDFSKLRFIEPAGVAFFNNLILWLHYQETHAMFMGHTHVTPSIKFLDDSLFFEQHLGKKLLPVSAPRSTTRPLEKISNDKIHSWLELNLIPWMSSKTGIRQSKLQRFRTCVSEIFNNIQDHTKYDLGSIFVQFYPKKNIIRIAISDFGNGIPESVRKRAGGLTDHEAIIQAVQIGFTTKSKPTNQGMGLNILIETIVGNNIGRVTIYSLGGSVLFYNLGPRSYGTIPAHYGFAPGTTFDIEIDTEAIKSLDDGMDEEEDLEWW